MKTKSKAAPTVEKDDRGRGQAVCQLESIKEMVAALEGEDREQAEQTIQEYPLSIEVRSGWHCPGAESTSEEFMILLGTGGPACRIIGELGQGDEPESPRLEYQDWFTPWQALPLSPEDCEAVLTYCRCFYFGS